MRNSSSLIILTRDLGFTFRLQAEKYGKGHLDESLSNKILPPFGVKMESGRPHDGNKQTTPLEAASVTLDSVLTFDRPGAQPNRWVFEEILISL